MHMCGLVFTKTRNFQELEKLLNPYDEEVNPDSHKFDWYVAIGRYDGENPFVPAILKHDTFVKVTDAEIAGFDEIVRHFVIETWKKLDTMGRAQHINDKHYEYLERNESIPRNFDEARGAYGDRQTMADWFSRRAPGIAFVTSDGEWVDPSEGWRCVGGPEKKREYVKRLTAYIDDHPDEYVTLVDFHF